MTDLTLFRVYEPHELGDDGYPLAWHALSRIADGDPDDVRGVKDLVRAAAGQRCVRCGHPYEVGRSGRYEGDASGRDELADQLGLDPDVIDHAFEDIEISVKVDLDRTPRVNWSACDERCTHGGPIRWRSAMTGDWHRRDDDLSVHDVEFMLKEVDAVEAAWRILTVHHLNGRKHDLRWWNLAALCQRCHLVIQGKVAMEQVYPLEHSDWFRPYAAGFYAASYLGQNLTRAETLERLDELLALECVA